MKTRAPEAKAREKPRLGGGVKTPPCPKPRRRSKAEIKRTMAKARRVRDWKRRQGLLKPKPAEHRRGYKVDVLPLRAQAVVFDGYRRGVSYRKIRAGVQAAGSDITEAALRSYWRKVWRIRLERIHEARTARDELAEALRVDPEGPSGQVAQEMLYTEALKRLEEVEGAPLWKLLKEARAQERVRGKSAPGEKGKGSEARKESLSHRLDQLYGPGVVVVEEVSDDEESRRSKDS